MILGTAPIEGRIAGIVDIPNVCATVAIPTGIFDFDIRPNVDGPKKSVPDWPGPPRPDPIHPPAFGATRGGFSGAIP